MAVHEASRSSANDAEAAEAIADVTRTVEDYFLGWYDADPERMRRALHPDLAKRSHVAREDAPPTIRAVTASQMIGWTGDGEGRTTDPAERRLEILVDEVHDTIASVRVHAAPYIEYLHLARTADGWRIVNALWQRP
jgi:Putative lumazine-binding